MSAARESPTGTRPRRARERAPQLPPPARHPSLLEINTRVWLYELGFGLGLGRAATLAEVPDAALAPIVAEGFDWLWLLGVWETGEAGRAVSLQEREWLEEYRGLLPDYTSDDVCGSPFAIREYTVNAEFGGPEALAQFRRRLAERGIRLMLDFVPNHTGLDHSWVTGHPEYYIPGTEEDIAREPMNYHRVEVPGGSRVLAHGRDPYFPGWPDTLQLNYRHLGLREAMMGVLDTIASKCDGVRCDMAMLPLPDVIQRTWGERSMPSDGTPPNDASFWTEAIPRVRRLRPDFVFMAEAYWDLEWTLQQQGFDYTYDKRLYDRLHSRDASAVRGHLHADAEYQRHSARFLENHDEPRAADAFPPPVDPAAAVIALLSPGLHFVHDGQEDGRRIRTSNHLRRRAPEPPDAELRAFYDRLFACIRRPEVRNGQWQLLEPRPAWDGNPTWDRLVAFAWHDDQHRLVAAVNYGETWAQGYVPMPFPDLDGRAWLLRDLVNAGVSYTRDGADLVRQGLYLDLPAWRAHVFELLAAEGADTQAGRR
ncbi:MAG TPA: alpha-amylase family glycosyl hydrolase [Gemmatimonadales bacterium]|nr:alpha-amylase family glycosyl hydrolase [Gemmatimonadales bacterium]